MASNFNYDKVKDLTRQLLEAIGEDPNRPGLLDTPRRVADYWREFIEYDPGNQNTTFESVTVDQMVVVSGMRVWSMCEHHMLPFWCDVSVGYITDKKVLGLSKFGRVAKKHSRKLQIQERLVADIADDIMAIIGTKNVAVVARGEHLCMTMRGIEMPAVMTSSSINGSFKQQQTRAEFLDLAQVKRA